jgi:hypothetical protein
LEEVLRFKLPHPQVKRSNPVLKDDDVTQIPNFLVGHDENPRRIPTALLASLPDSVADY